MAAMASLAFTACVLAAGEVHDTPAGVICLFNGENLDGWYTFIKERGRDADPQSVFLSIRPTKEQSRFQADATGNSCRYASVTSLGLHGRDRPPSTALKKTGPIHIYCPQHQLGFTQTRASSMSLGEAIYRPRRHSRAISPIPARL